MSKARNSPLRDKMLELHKSGIDVKFIGEGSAQVFLVKMGRGVSLDDHFKLLEDIRISIDKSVESARDQKLTRQSAQEFVESMKKLNR